MCSGQHQLSVGPAGQALGSPQADLEGRWGAGQVCLTTGSEGKGPSN